MAGAYFEGSIEIGEVGKDGSYGGDDRRSVDAGSGEQIHLEVVGRGFVREDPEVDPIGVLDGSQLFRGGRVEVYIFGGHITESALCRHVDDRVAESAGAVTAVDGEDVVGREGAGLADDERALVGRVAAQETRSRWAWTCGCGYKPRDHRYRTAGCRRNR